MICPPQFAGVVSEGHFHPATGMAKCFSSFSFRREKVERNSKIVGWVIDTPSGLCSRRRNGRFCILPLRSLFLATFGHPPSKRPTTTNCVGGFAILGLFSDKLFWGSFLWPEQIRIRSFLRQTLDYQADDWQTSVTADLSVSLPSSSSIEIWDDEFLQESPVSFAATWNSLARF